MRAAQSCLTPCDPIDCSPSGPWDFPGKNTGVVCRFLLHSKGRVKVKVKSLSHVRLFATQWTVALQTPLPMGFSRQEYWSGLPFPSSGDLPDPGIEPRSPALQADALTSEPPTWPLIPQICQTYYVQIEALVFTSSGKCYFVGSHNSRDQVRALSADGPQHLEDCLQMKWPTLSWKVSSKSTIHWYHLGNHGSKLPILARHNENRLHQLSHNRRSR